jgi:hypothetical protein
VRGSSVQRRSATLGETSAGAVKQELARPIGQRMAQPLQELDALQRQMRAQREAGESDRPAADDRLQAPAPEWPDDAAADKW